MAVPSSWLIATSTPTSYIMGEIVANIGALGDDTRYLGDDTVLTGDDARLAGAFAPPAAYIASSFYKTDWNPTDDFESTIYQIQAAGEALSWGPPVTVDGILEIETGSYLTQEDGYKILITI